MYYDLLMVKKVHCCFEAAGKKAQDCFACPVDGGLYQEKLFTCEIGQHEIYYTLLVGVFRRTPDSDADADKTPAAQLLYYGFHAAMPAGAAAFSYPYPSRRQVKVVLNHDDIFGKQLKPGRERGYGLPAVIHKRLRARQDNILAGHARAGYPGFALLLIQEYIVLFGETPEAQKAGVMAVAGVRKAGVAQPDN